MSEKLILNIGGYSLSVQVDESLPEGQAWAITRRASVFDPKVGFDDVCYEAVSLVSNHKVEITKGQIIWMLAGMAAVPMVAQALENGDLYE